ncbi:MULTISPECIES: hypothetical protein [Paenibacillus]|uniref:hypothetical protein n=1 Tax=Paenibacillus TaxID=44249 RepID=UPI00096EE0BB|nr:hypothetical protein [Paenibacillus odorifer]OME13986.1 hypothetical protein BSK60_14120 [Paenibacillus odorifer]
MTKLRRSHDELTLEEVSNYFSDSLESLRLLKQNVLNGVKPISNQFIGLTPREVEEIFISREAELDRLSTFNLLAATEASLRVDFDERVNKRGKSDLDRLFLKIYSDNKERVSLEDHILESWKKVKPGVLHIFSDYKSLLTYRHWLAHGRYWIPNLARKHNDFHSLYPICFAIEAELRINR